MLSKLCFTIKFIVRFIFILSFIFIIFIGGYFKFFYSDLSIVEKAIDKITIENNLGNDYKIKFNEISEKWSYNKLTLDTKSAVIKSNNIEIELKDIKIKIDVIQTLIKKELKIKSILVDNININIKEEKKDLNLVNYENENNKYKNYIIDIIKIIDDIALDIKTIKIKSTKNNINLNNISMVKSQFEDAIKISNKNNVEIITRYNYNPKSNSIMIDTNISSNNYYLTKIFKNIGQEDILDFIKINDIYTIIGDLKSNIHVYLDLNNFKIKNYDAKIYLDGNKILLNNYSPITLTNSVGIIYINDSGFYSNEITANLNNKSSKVKITQNKKESILFEFETQADVTKLSDLAGFELRDIIEGTERFKGSYLLNFNDQDYLSIKSDFEDINYLTSVNLKKEEGFELNAFFDDENEKIDLKIKQGNNNIDLKIIDYNFYNINISINQEIIKNIKERGVFVNGFIYEEDLFNIISDLNRIKKMKNNLNNNASISENNESDNVEINVNLKNTKIKDMYFENINMLYQNNSISLLFNEKNSEGNIQFNTITNKMKINIDKLNINTNKTKKLMNETIENKDIFSIGEEDNKNKLFKIVLNASNIKIDDLPPLNIKSNLNYKNGVFNSNEMHLYDNESIINVNAKYQYDNTNNITTIIEIDNETPILEIKDVDGFKNKYIKSKSIFKSENIKIYGNFSWNSANVIEAGKTLTGFFSFDFKKGLLPNNSTQVGIAKMLNIINIDSLFNMFSLDFKNVKEGISFNSIKGSFNVSNNKIETTPRIIFDSDLFFLDISGDLDYVKNEYNLKIDAIVPLINKAPIIALFVGVAPEVVGVIWLIDKIAGDKINETFSRTKFDIKGNFENPIFTNKIEDRKIQ